MFFGQELDGLAANLGVGGGDAVGVGAWGVGVGGWAHERYLDERTQHGFWGRYDWFGRHERIGGGYHGYGRERPARRMVRRERVVLRGTSGSSSSDSSIGSLGVIVGVGTSKSGTSITQPNAQTTYESWEFWYDPRIEMLKQGANVTGGGMTGGGAPGGGVGSQSASSYGQNISGGSNAPTNGTTGSTGTSGSTNPNSSVPNPF